MTMARRDAGLAIFFALLVTMSAVLETLLARAGGIQHAGGLAAATMAVPGLCALIALLVTTRSLRGIGWRLGRPRYLGLAILLPLLIVTPVYLLVSAAGLAPFSTARLTHVAQLNFGVHAGPLAALALVAVVGLAADSIVAMGEEIGWRGYLFPELAKPIRQPAQHC